MHEDKGARTFLAIAAALLFKIIPSHLKDAWDRAVSQTLSIALRKIRIL